MSTSSDENFLARWSRLKGKPDRADASGARANEQSLPASASTPTSRAPREHSEPKHAHAQHPGETPQRQDAKVEDEGTKGSRGIEMRDFSDFDFEKLDFNSDYTQFMKDDVPEEARTKALRQLWTSNPVLANMDGLDDYCEDYTDAAMVPVGGVRTAYQIGKGFLSDTEVAEWEALGRPDDPEAVAAAGGVADRAEPSSDAGSPVVEAGSDARGDAGEHATALADATARECEPVVDAGALIDSAPCTGAACAAVVKQEEQAALYDYGDSVSKDAENGAGGAKKLCSRSDYSAGKDRSQT